jgi:hypothetical protein
MDRDGDFVISWNSRGQDDPASTLGLGVFAQRYNSVGVVQGTEFRVNTYATSEQRTPSVAMDADGDFVVAWQSLGQDGSSYGVFAQRYGLAAPAVSAHSFIFADAPHRLSFSFDQNVSASLGPEDILIENLTTMQTVPSSDFAISYNPITNTATFSYIGNSGGISGVLADANYQATLLPSGITNAAGVPLQSGLVFGFFFLNGDANHDGRVNLSDFNIVAANFGQSPRDFTQGDFSYDTVVNLLDFNILASRFGAALFASDAAGGTLFGQGPISSISPLRSTMEDVLS